MEKNGGIELCHVATDEGDWAEVVPEHGLYARLSTANPIHYYIPK